MCAPVDQTSLLGLDQCRDWLCSGLIMCLDEDAISRRMFAGMRLLHRLGCSIATYILILVDKVRNTLFLLTSLHNFKRHPWSPKISVWHASIQAGSSTGPCSIAKSLAVRHQRWLQAAENTLCIVAPSSPSRQRKEKGAAQLGVQTRERVVVLGGCVDTRSSWPLISCSGADTRACNKTEY